MQLTTKQLTTKPSITRSDYDNDARAEMYVLIGTHKVRLNVRSNSYKFQCNAVAYVWHPTELKWNVVYSIPHPNMATPEGLVYSSMADLTPNFKSDLDALLAGATAILET